MDALHDGMKANGLREREHRHWQRIPNFSCAHNKCGGEPFSTTTRYVDQVDNNSGSWNSIEPSYELLQCILHTGTDLNLAQTNKLSRYAVPHSLIIRITSFWNVCAFYSTVEPRFHQLHAQKVSGGW